VDGHLKAVHVDSDRIDPGAARERQGRFPSVNGLGEFPDGIIGDLPHCRASCEQEKSRDRWEQAGEWRKRHRCSFVIHSVNSPGAGGCIPSTRIPDVVLIEVQSTLLCSARQSMSRRELRTTPMVEEREGQGTKNRMV
jgi:hypothetical protein